MQSQDLAQLSESLLTLLSVQNGTRHNAPGQPFDLNAHQLNHHGAQQGNTYYTHAHSQHEPQYGPEPAAAQQRAHQQAMYDPWNHSFHGLHDSRPVNGAAGPYPVLAHPSHAQHAAAAKTEGSNGSPSDSTIAWGSHPQDDGVSSRSLPEQHGFPTSNKLASGLWGGSLWSNGGDSIWSTPADRPQSDGQMPSPPATVSQDDSHLDMLVKHHNAPLQRPAPGFAAHQPSQYKNGHAMSGTAFPGHMPPNLTFPQDRQADIRQQGPSALLAALQAGGPHAMPNNGQAAMLNGPQHAMLNGGQLAAQRPYLHQAPHPLHSLFHQQQHQQQQQQQIQQLPAAQSPPMTSHMGRMPPPGFPRPLQQNLQEAQQQRASAARAFQSAQALSNGTRPSGGGGQPPPPPPRPSLQVPPPPNRFPINSGARNMRPQSTPIPMHSKPSGQGRTFGGTLPKADMGELSAGLHGVVDQLRPSQEEQERQKEAFQQVRSTLLREWPEAQVHLFGSTANCLSICNNNDIDVCLELPEGVPDQAGKGEVVEQMGQLLEQAGMRDVLPLPKARVPVVKFVVGDTNTKVDITVNNILAIVNTKLLKDYGALDKRLLQLVFVVKLWAKRRQVNDSYRGTLSSYCYVLMCIHLLQQRSPPILPCLQAIEPTHTRTVGQWNCDYFDDVQSLAGFGAANKESLAELVWAFFEYWAWRHDYNNSVVSVRTGGFLTKSHKEWTRRVGNERHLVCIEDPFEVSHDLGRTVDRQTSGVLHKEFERAACILRDLPQPLDKLMDPYRAGKSD